MAERTRPKIFITHSWRDMGFSRRVYNDLQRQGFEIFFDEAAIQGGHRLAEEINRGLEWCDIYIPILSKSAIDSPWCWEEINAAISLSNEKARAGRPRIIPILAEDCQIPAILRGRSYIGFAEKYEPAFVRLVKAVDTFYLEVEQKIAERKRQEELARKKEEVERLAREKDGQEQLERLRFETEQKTHQEAKRLSREQTAKRWIENLKSALRRTVSFSVPILGGNLLCVLFITTFNKDLCLPLGILMPSLASVIHVRLERHFIPNISIGQVVRNGGLVASASGVYLIVSMMGENMKRAVDFVFFDPVALLRMILFVFFLFGWFACWGILVSTIYYDVTNRK